VKRKKKVRLPKNKNMLSKSEKSKQGFNDIELHPTFRNEREHGKGGGGGKRIVGCWREKELRGLLDCIGKNELGLGVKGCGRHV